MVVCAILYQKQRLRLQPKQRLFSGVVKAVCRRRTDRKVVAFALLARVEVSFVCEESGKSFFLLSCPRPFCVDT